MSPAHHAHHPAAAPDALQGPKVAPSPQNHRPSATGGGRSRVAVSVLSNQQRKVLPDFSSSSEQGRNTEDGKSRHIRVQFELFHRPPMRGGKAKFLALLPQSSPTALHAQRRQPRAFPSGLFWREWDLFRCLFASKSR